MNKLIAAAIISLAFALPASAADQHSQVWRDDGIYESRADDYDA